MAQKLVVDNREQAKQIGEMQWALDTAAIELGNLLTGKTAFHRQGGGYRPF